MFELAPCPPEVTQSVEGQNRPSAVTISLNRRTLKTVDLPDLHVNARGALTRIHNLGAGEHGDLVRITVPQELLPEIQADARRQAHFRLRLEVKPTAPKPGGLTLFGARAGRYGMSPTITIQLNPLT